MSVYNISLSGGHKVAHPIRSVEEFTALRSSSAHLDYLAKAREGDVKAKRMCVNIMYQGHPNDDGTIAGSKRLSRHFFFDIDDRQEAERVISLFRANPSAYEFDMIERSINGGLHIVAKRTWGKTILECQCLLALQLHCEMDTNNNDPTRMCFSTSASADDLIHVSTDLFNDQFDAAAWEEEQQLLNREEDLPEGAHHGDKHYRPWEHTWSSQDISVEATAAEHANSEETKAVSVAATEPTAKVYADEYEGIAYADIISKYWEMFNAGKTPCEGSRNTLTFELVENLAPLCDYNQKWLEHVVPQYDNFPREEWQKTIANALKQPHKGMPYRTRTVLTAMRKAQKLAIVGGSENRPPQMPKNLTAFHRQLVKNLPDVYIPTVCESVFPALGAHLHGVTFRYIDGKPHEASFQSVLIMNFSRGKGCIDEPIKYIMADIAESDMKSRMLEAEYKRNNPAGKKKAPRPANICIQMLMTDITNAAFNQRLIDCNNNGGRFVYTKTNEIETLYQLQSNNVHVTSIMKQAWDCDVVGQDRVSADSVTGAAPCRWNYNASATPSRARKFLGPYVNDGTLSRINFNTADLPEGDDDIPKYAEYTQKYGDALAPFIARLNAATGEIRCKKAEQLARDMDRENKERAALYGSEAYKVLSFRANVDAYKKAMVLYILNGQKWSKQIEEYVRWSIQWDLWLKMRYFGDLLEKAMMEDELAVCSGPKNLLAQLPDTFTEDQLNALRHREGKTGSVGNLLRVWKHRKYIVYDDTARAYVKIGRFADTAI